MKELFLDTNAHVFLNEKTNLSEIKYGHPLSPSLPGRIAAKEIEYAREDIAFLIGAKNANQIIFTTGATQGCEWGLNILKNICCNDLVNSSTDLSISMSQFEHNAVYDAATNIFQNDIKYLKNNSDGVVFNKLLKFPQNKTNKVVCMHIQNEIGTIQPIKELKQNCKYLFSDMTQSFGKIPVNVTELDVDIAIGSSHKFGGSSGIGFIYLKNTEHWLPFGTGSRYGLDCTGSPNVTGIKEMSLALKEATKSLDERTNNMITFTNIIEKEFENLGFEIIGKKTNRIPNTTFVNIPKRSLELLLKLEEFEIYCGLGSACGSLHSGPSKTIKALGKEGDIYDYMRISQWGDYGANEAEYFVDCLKKII